MVKRKMREIYEDNGFNWRFEKNYKDGSKMLYCTERKTSTQCPALGVMKQDGTIVTKFAHEGHVSNGDLSSSKMVSVELKRRATESTIAPREITESLRNEFGPIAVSLAGSRPSLQRKIQRQRDVLDDNWKKVNMRNPVFQGSATVDMDGNNLMVFDKVNAQSGGRSIAFASETMLKTLAASDVFMADGTFEVVPKEFQQLWVILGRISSDVYVPLVYTFMEKKTHSDYVMIIEELRKTPALATWDPKYFIADMESPQEKAIGDQFPNIQVFFCLFHIAQAWRRRLASLGLSKEIEFGKSMYKFWNLLLALPFCPVQTIVSQFNEVCSTLPQPNSSKAIDFIRYLKSNYIGTHPSLPFPPSKWNVVDRSLGNLPRTTNVVESNHRILARSFRRCDGRRIILMSDVLKCIHDECRKVKNDVVCLAADPNYQCVSRRHLKDVLKDGRLLKVIENRPTPPHQPLVGLQYLQAVVAAKR